MVNCTCGAGSGLEGADSSITLTATGSNYSPGKFPHLAGCKIFTLPEMSLDLVWIRAYLLPSEGHHILEGSGLGSVVQRHASASQQKVAYQFDYCLARFFLGV